MPNFKRRLTDRLVHSAELRPETGQREYYDMDQAGFGVRVTAAGTRTYFASYKLGGRSRRFTIGPASEMRVADARQQAAAARALVRQGADPVQDRRQKVADAVAADLSRIGGLVDRYFELRVRADGLRSEKDLRRLFDLYVVARWKERPVKSITRRDVVELLDEVRAAGKRVQANRIRAATRKFFSWLLERDYVERNPCDGVKRLTVESARDRVLSDDEVCRIWHAAAGLRAPAYQQFVRLLILCGQRRTETARTDLSDIDLQSGSWIIPAERSKNKRAHRVPLSPLAREVIGLAAGGRNAGPLFTTDGMTPICQFVKMKARLDKGAGVSNWVLHDLRRTVASGLAQLGVSPHVIELILNHSPRQISGVAAIYNRHTYEVEKRAGLKTWSEHVAQIIRREQSNVVEVAFGRADADLQSAGGQRG